MNDRAASVARRGSRHSGPRWVGEEALAIRPYRALAAANVRTGLLLAVNHSGDSDSTGPVADNILGPMYEVDALPAELLEARDLVETVANDLTDVFVDGQPVDIDRCPPS